MMRYANEFAPLRLKPNVHLRGRIFQPPRRDFNRKLPANYYLLTTKESIQ